ncbi:MAG TPA: sigma-70 family RNA polymerase sigma factor, partial [Tepidisphaeraceae bacterium]
MTHLNVMQTIETSDASLVAESLSENREAFGAIVARYQTLICSLAYSGIGNLSQSEDLAQETFIAAWKQLSTLREPAKLRPWLCGIARNLTGIALRKQVREPVHAAESLEVAQELPSRELPPSEQAITKEEETILWRSLERIPEIYREPLVLFYREHQSIAAVAEELELTEDNVKQRLSRGRKLLHEHVLAFVEGALEKTSPGKAFTSSVVAVLPVMAASAKATTAGAALATSGAAAKGVAAAGSLGGLFVILGSAYVSLRAQADDSKSPRERLLMLRMFGMRITFILLSVALFFVAMQFKFFRMPIHFDYLAAVLYFYYSIDAVLLSPYQAHRRQQIQIEENTYVEYEWRMPRRFTDSASDSVVAKKTNRLKLIRLSAFGQISGAMMAAMIVAMSIMVNTQQTWKHKKQFFVFGHLFFVTASVAVGSLVATILAFRLLGLARNKNTPRSAGTRWSLRSLFGPAILGPSMPRFTQPLRSRSFLVVPATLGMAALSILCVVRFAAFAPHGASHNLSSESPVEFLVFGLVIVLAYASLIGILAWGRGKIVGPESYTLTEIRPGQLKAVTIISQTIRTTVSDIDGRRKAMENLRAKLADAGVNPRGSLISI